MVPPCRYPTYITMYVPRCVSPLEMYSTVTSTAVSDYHSLVTSAFHRSATLRVCPAPPRWTRPEAVPPSAFGDLLSRWPRSVISEDHLCVITHAPVAKLRVLTIFFMHITIVNHASAIYTLPVHYLAHCNNLLANSSRTSISSESCITIFIILLQLLDQLA